MVSHQLVYVTGMLEVILAPSDSSGGSKRVAELSEASEIVKTGGGSFPRPRKSSKRAAEAFRGLGNRQNESLKLSEASEGSKRVAEAFRGPGRGRQGRRPSLPGTRKTSQAAAAAPRPRKAFQQVAEVCIDLRATASNQNHASERSLYPYGDLPDWWF